MKNNSVRFQKRFLKFCIIVHSTIGHIGLLKATVTVFLCSRLMYWTNFTKKLATIEKARMDGVQERKQPLTEMKREFAEPGNLVADPNGEHIYYIETKKKKIVRLSLKGNAVMTVGSICILLSK